MIPMNFKQKSGISPCGRPRIFVSNNTGDPQAALDFGEDEDVMYQKYTGRYVTVDSSGVVTKAKKPEGEEKTLLIAVLV